ncbi:hypothetical protein NQ317_001174 [Molorchus minor]|uniref:Lariat debranching enzyme C-terminal domain-containing protein n=1 Tax=Molorchus minor TaxID=1323400 RepID=A0ABQ9J1R3_9CUCU|nr:hypothetical protein NQ317_001174 [Molorchus minor]
MKIAVEGCAHGELENIYDTVQLLEEKEGIKIDLLMCCGDFQSSRNEEDLKCMAVPPKYSKICTFYKYYTGEKEAPILTIFIGGNHEASNYLQELPYGGWVAPNIYYMGYASVINIAGLKIAGLSGIYKSRDYMKGHFENAPFDENTKRSVYHIRNLEVFRLKQLSGPLDIFLSHDWPNGVYRYGNINQLLKKKPFFQEDIESNQLGSKPCEDLLHQLKPKYWFAAHLHCKFAALVPHEDGCVTKFLALDKCLPKRKFLQIVDIPHDENSKIQISYDLEWLTILYLTNHLLSVKNVSTFMPGPGGSERHEFTPNEDEKQHILTKFSGDLAVPKNFEKSVPGFSANNTPKKMKNIKQPEAKLNPQTVLFCETLSIDDPICLVSEANGTNISLTIDQSFNDQNTIDSFINDTVEVDISTSSIESTPSKMLSALSLPDPKSEMVDDFESDAKDNTEEELDTCSQSSGDIGVLVSVEKKKCDSPVTKKFKRRNAELYTNDEK